MYIKYNMTKLGPKQIFYTLASILLLIIIIYITVNGGMNKYNKSAAPHHYQTIYVVPNKYPTWRSQHMWTGWGRKYPWVYSGFNPIKRNNNHQSISSDKNDQPPQPMLEESSPIQQGDDTEKSSEPDSVEPFSSFPISYN